MILDSRHLLWYIFSSTSWCAHSSSQPPFPFLFPISVGGKSGVLRTRVGYAGGQKKSPTYYSMGDHTECIQLDFDPTVTSFEKLLDDFWNSHDATRSSSRQYKSIIFYSNDEQKALAEASRDKFNKKNGKKAATELLPLNIEEGWTDAEDYHQKYYLRSSEFMPLFKGMSNKELRECPVAAKVNAFISGDISKDDLIQQLKDFKVDSKLIDEVGAKHTNGKCTCF